MSQNWPETNLAELCSLFTDGDWIETKDQAAQGIRLVQTGNVGVGYFKDRREKARFVSTETFNRLKCEEVFSGDCLVSRLPDPVGRACIIPDTKDRMITAVDCTIIRFDDNKIIPAFFEYYSQSHSYLSAIDSLCSGATRKRVSRKNLGTVPVPLPPLPEQKRIVSLLDEAFAGIDTAIANTEKNLANARELFESYLNSVFTKKGDGWEYFSIGEIAQVKGGKRVPKGYKLQTEATAHPYISVSDFNDSGSIELDKIRYVSKEVHEQIRKYTISSDDLYISIAGTIGKSGIIPKELNGANLTENACKLVLKDGVSNRYLYFFTKTESFKEQAQKNTRTAAQPKLALERLKTIQLSVPSLDAQKSLVRQFNDLLSRTEDLEKIYRKKYSELKNLKQSLLQKAFAGEL